MDELYTIPENPAYDPNIRRLQRTDRNDAEEVWNPLIARIIENIAAVLDVAKTAQEQQAKKPEVYITEEQPTATTPWIWLQPVGTLREATGNLVRVLESIETGATQVEWYSGAHTTLCSLIFVPAGATVSGSVSAEYTALVHGWLSDGVFYTSNTDGEFSGALEGAGHVLLYDITSGSYYDYTDGVVGSTAVTRLDMPIITPRAGVLYGTPDGKLWAWDGKQYYETTIANLLAEVVPLREGVAEVQEAFDDLATTVEGVV